jgi:hypothetical protein
MAIGLRCGNAFEANQHARLTIERFMADDYGKELVERNRKLLERTNAKASKIARLAHPYRTDLVR